MQMNEFSQNDWRGYLQHGQWKWPNGNNSPEYNKWYYETVTKVKNGAQNLGNVIVDKWNNRGNKVIDIDEDTVMMPDGTYRSREWYEAHKDGKDSPKEEKDADIKITVSAPNPITNGGSDDNWHVDDKGIYRTNDDEYRHQQARKAYADKEKKKRNRGKQANVISRTSNMAANYIFQSDFKVNDMYSENDFRYYQEGYLAHADEKKSKWPWLPGGKNPPEYNKWYYETVTKVKNAAEKAGKDISTAAGKVGEGAKELYKDTREAAGNAYNTAKTRAGDLYEDAREGAGKAYNTAKTRAGDLYDDAREGASKAYDRAKNTATSAYGKAARGAKTVANDAKEVYGKASSGVRNAYGKASTAASNAYGRASSGVTNTARKVSDSINNAAKPVMAKAKNVANDAYGATAGIRTNISNATSGVRKTAGRVAEGVRNAVDDAREFVTGDEAEMRLNRAKSETAQARTRKNASDHMYDKVRKGIYFDKDDPDYAKNEKKENDLANQELRYAKDRQARAQAAYDKTLPGMKEKASKKVQEEVANIRQDMEQTAQRMARAAESAAGAASETYKSAKQELKKQVADYRKTLSEFTDEQLASGQQIIDDLLNKYMKK